jgi:hydroxyacylglutathione hydrolase
MIQVEIFYAHNELRNYSYLLINTLDQSSWVIDPYDAKVLKEYIKKKSLRLLGVLNTHQHHDHIKGNDELVLEFQCPIIRLKDSEDLILDKHTVLKAYNAPGHTMDHQIFFLKSHEKFSALFAGDTLFYGGVGNCKNGGDVSALFETIKEILKVLPPGAIIYPGHDYEERNLKFALREDPQNAFVKTRLREIEGRKDNLSFHDLEMELKTNPFFRMGQESLESFKRLRTLRDTW